jgi:ligand-binding sensor protein
VHKVPSKDIREPVVMEVQQVTSVLQGQHLVHQDSQVLKEQQVIMGQQV